jgi:hypothetical protein
MELIAVLEGKDLLILFYRNNSLFINALQYRLILRGEIKPLLI